MARPDLRRLLLLGTALAAAPAAALPGAPTTIANSAGSGPAFSNPAANTLDIKLNAARTVLQYSNFGIASGEIVNFRFDNRSDLAVVHATQSAITVDGTLNSFVGAGSTYGGNVWLLSAAGVFFGAGSHVDVGGLVASTSIPSDLLNAQGGINAASSVLNPSVLSFDFGNGNGIVSIAGNAQITGHGGTLAFIAPSVTTGKGAVISGAGDTSVLYGAAQRYTVRFTQQAGNDLDLLDFEVPGLTAGTLSSTPLTLAGTTAAGNVYVAAVNRADAVRAVLDAQGSIGATSAGTEGGVVVLTSGGGIANRAAAPLFGDGTYRQGIRTSGAINADRGVSATATGDVIFDAPVTAGGSIVVRGVNVFATELTAGQDIIIRTGDAAGSSGPGTPGSGYGYGYGYGYGSTPAYGPEGGNFYANLVSGGDDIAVDAFGGSIDIGRIVLAGTGADTAGDPLGLLDAAGDGRRLALRTYGANASDIYLGDHDGYSGVSGGTSLVLNSGRDAYVYETGDVTLTSITATGAIDAFTDGALTIGTLSGRGALTATSGTALDIGSATTTLDGNDNGQIALEGGTSARLGTGSAATDIIVVSNNGNATVGTATAGDDLIVRAFAGDVSVGSASVGVGGTAPDTDGTFISYGEGSDTLFRDLELDSYENGRVIDLGASRTARVVSDGGGDFRAALVLDPGTGTGGNVMLGLGTGTIAGQTRLTVTAANDIDVNLASSTPASETYTELDAGRDARFSVASGNAHVDNASTGRDLTILAPAGEASFGTAYVGQDLLLSGRTAGFGDLGGNGDQIAPRDVTVRTSAGDFSATYVTATRDVTLDIHGGIDVAYVDAGQDAKLTSTGLLRIGGVPCECLPGVFAGRDILIDAAGLSLTGELDAGRDLRITSSVGTFTNLDPFTAGRDLTIDVPGALSLGEIAAVRNLTLIGSSVQVGDLQAGGSASLTARTGDAGVDTARTRLDLSVVAANGLARIGDARVGQDLLLSGRTVSLGSLGPYSETSGYGYGGYGYGYGYGYGTTTYPTRDVTILATGGGFELPLDSIFAAGRDLTIDVSGELVLGGVTAGRNLTLAGSGVYVDDTARAGEDARLTARTTDLFVDTVIAGDDATLAAAQSLDALRVTTTGAGTDAEGDGANVRLTGVSLSIAEIAAAGSLFIDASDTANFGFGAAGATAGVDLTASAAGLDFGVISAGRDLRLTATGGGVIAGGPSPGSSASSGRDVIVVSSDELSDIRFSAVRDLILTGTSVEADEAVAGRDLTVTATAGNIRFGTATAGDDIRLNAATFSGPAGVQGGNIDVGVARTTAATGDFSDTEGDGSNIVANGRDIRFVRAIAPTDIRLTGTGLVTLGVAASNSDDDADAEAGNDLVVTGAALLTGPLEAGRDVTLTATAGGIEGRGAIVAGRNFTGAASGANTQSGDIAAGGFIILAGDSVVAAGLDANSFANATGNSVTVDRIASRGNANVTAIAGDARVGSANVKNDLTVIADAGLARIGDARVGHDLLLRGASVFLGSLDGYSETSGYGYGGYGYGYGYGYGSTFTRTHDATLTALNGGIDGGAALNVTNDIVATATGGITLGALTAGNDVRATAGLVLTTGSVTATRDALLSGGRLATGPVSAGRDLSLTATASGIVAGALTAVRDLTLNAAQTLSFDSAGAGRDLRLTGNAINGGAATAGRDLTATAATTLTLASATAGDDVRLSGATIDVDVARATGAGDDTEADGANVVATGGTITLEQVVAARDILVTGTGPVTVGIAGSGAATGTAGDYFAQAGNDIVLTGASLLTGPLDAGRDVRLTATAGGIDARGAINAGRDAIATATGLARFAASVGAARDVVLQGGTLATNGLAAGRDLSLTATAGSIGSGGNLTAVRDLTVDGVGVTLGTATAGRDLTLNARSGTLTLASATAGDDARLSGATQVLGQVSATGLGADSEADGSNVVLTGGSITASQLTAATDIGVTGTGAVSVGQATAGRDVTVAGGTVGGALQLSGRDVTVTSGGAFAATAGLVASRDLRLTAGTTLSFANLTAARDLFLTAATVAGGSAVATRDLTVMATTAITGTLYQAGRDLVLDPNEAINVGTARATGNATLVGASVIVGTLDAGGTTNVQATAGGITVDTLRSTGAATLLASGKVDLGDSTTPALRIVGGDLDVRRSLVASTLAVETPGQMVIGGTAAQGETGFRLAAADVARLRVSGIANFYAGVTTANNDGAQTPGGDLILQDFTYDPANLPRLAFFADRNHVIDVQGSVLPTTTGGAIQFGDANVDGRFRPDSVYVSGRIGTAELVLNCFGKIVAVSSLSIFAVNDVIFGTGEFRTAVKGTAAGDIDVARNVPGVAGPQNDQLFAVTTQLNVGAGGKVVSQNTASNRGEYVGLFVVGSGATAPIVNIGTARAVDLSGSIVDTTGTLRSGPLVARASELGSGGVNGAVFRFNGCIVGSSDCGGAGGNGETPSEALRIEDYQPPRPIDITDTPLTTVLVIDQQASDLDVLTIGTDSNAIVIKKKPGGN